MQNHEHNLPTSIHHPIMISYYIEVTLVYKF